MTPYTTVAANDIKQGTVLYIQQFDGMKLPNSKVHNGCVRVDDTGYILGKKHIDWFVAKESNYEFLDGRYSVDKVTVYEGQNCPLLNYQ